MSHQPRLISDPFEFAQRGDTLTGELDARNLPRLAGMLRDLGEEQKLHFELSGSRIGDKSFLDVLATASLVLPCQRCLGDVSRVVEVESRLLLVPRDEALPDEDLEEDDFDPVHAGRDFDVFEAVEEELLLALPLAPTHDDCSVPVAGKSGDESSPFAVLRGLKSRE